ncbi:hypothetical protein DPMN_042043 [Dreissena polymorpha]|uniref:Uncharacterized protein n=1 Tax=Dreissena polymorpha TaxID=45954 RepID=A0A9D4CYU6_DREPO|nr:hypothetical protein DPMN_042043 [Dreissena polymorpha]
MLRASASSRTQNPLVRSDWSTAVTSVWQTWTTQRRESSLRWRQVTFYHQEWVASLISLPRWLLQSLVWN